MSIRYRFLNIIALLTAFAAVSCAKDDKTVSLILGTSKLEFAKPDAASLNVNLQCNSSWTGEAREDWVSIAPASGSGNATIKVTVAANTFSARSAKVVFKAGTLTKTLTVTQASAEHPQPVPGGKPLSELSKPLSDDIIFSRNVMLEKQKNIVQGFDFTDEKHFYYAQGPAGNHNQYVCFAPGASKNRSSVMTLEGFGHMTQIVAERATDGKDYIWCNSNGQYATTSSSFEYGDNLSFSRLPYVAGSTVRGGWPKDGDTFVLQDSNNLIDLQVGIDFEARRMLVGARVKGVSARYHYVFDLDEALALPVKDVTLNVKTSSGTESRTVRARNLAECRRLGYFVIPRGTSPSQTYYYSHQGHEVYGDKVLFFEGNANGSEPNYSSVAYVTVYDYNGKVVTERTAVKAIEDNAALKSFGLTTAGYAEGEGLKLKGDKIYLQFACHNGSGQYRYSNILVYSHNLK